MVGHLTRIGREHDIGQHVECGAEGYVEIPRGECGDARGDEQHQQLFESVVVKHRQRLRRQQENKSPIFQDARVALRSHHMYFLQPAFGSVDARRLGHADRVMPSAKNTGRP